MHKYSAVTILRWGLAFTFFYAAIEGLLHPENWIGYLPPFLGNILPLRTVLTIFSVYEIALAALLFIGRKLYWVSLLSIITLVVITVFNLEILDVTFRDVGLAMAALALFELVKKQPTEKNSELV